MKEVKVKSGIVYQFVVLAAIIGYLGWGFYSTGDWNEIMLGALIGVMVGIGLPKKEDDE